MRGSGIPISLRIFQFVVIHTVKGFGVVNKAKIDVFHYVFLLALGLICSPFSNILGFKLKILILDPSSFLIHAFQCYDFPSKNHFLCILQILISCIFISI